MAAATNFSLDGQCALVIGGTSGIGRAIAAAYLEAGAKVIVAGRDAAKLERAVAELKAQGDAHGYRADVSDLAELRGLVGTALADHERIDVLVNSQGMTTLKPAEEFTSGDWDEVIGTDLRSVFFACTEIGRHMLGRGRGAIINIASLASYRGWQRSALYGISKAGVVSLTETLAAEWAGRGVRVNAIAPGFVMTNLNRDKMSAERKALALSRTPMGRFGETGDLAGAAIFLASSASSYVTGETIRVDGGFLAAGL
jgi:NAD(P)-dependent dehydrogenase (short-subunit alcohol dehydrogenase family)